MLMRILGPRSAVLRRLALGRMYSDDSRITPETTAGYAVNLEDSRSYDYAVEVIRSWWPDMQQLRAALPSISMMPVLLLWGADDCAVPAPSGLLLRASFRNAEYVVLPGTGHLPYEEAPKQFNSSLLRFLEK